MISLHESNPSNPSGFRQVDYQGIGQRPTLGLKDRGKCQWLKGIGRQSINRFSRYTRNPSLTKKVSAFVNPLLSGNDTGSSDHEILFDPSF